MSITEILPSIQTNTWQNALKSLITCPKALLDRLGISREALPWEIDLNFPLRVPESFVARMKAQDPNDPLLRQVLTTKDESLLTFGFDPDPLKETEANPLPGVLHKFHGRILITLTQACAIHCRYCFRRHFPYAQNRIGTKQWLAIQDYLLDHPEIDEVILSGGDPLMLSDDTLAEFLTILNSVPSLKIIRWHTRLPVVIPQRITQDFIALSQQSRLKWVMVYHINHPQEICPEIQSGVKALKNADCLVLNQSVLLRGVNDSLAILKQLSFDLLAAGILPYYVHLLDKVQGSQHFDLPLEEARSLEKALRESVPGYLMPRFVRELPGRSSKIHITELV